MKKILTHFLLLFVLLSSSELSAQTSHPFELGFNAGASWLKSDVKMKKLGGGAGFTFGQMYCMNQTSPLMWGWRFRYLGANTYGQGKERSYGIANNSLLNGTRDTVLDYYSSPGYVYQNYKTRLDELSLELVLGANKMRERYHVYPYIFGGLGLTKAVAKTDQLNANNMRYDYALIDSMGGSVTDVYDGTYESLADGNVNPRWKFMPSLGVGLGFQITKGFSMGLEHKMTWALNDVVDGQQWSNTDGPTGNNDKYHYSSVWLKFSFGRGAKHTSNTTTNTTTNNIVTTTNTPAVAPTVNFTNPASAGMTIGQQTTSITGKITDINSISDMSMTLNGMPVTGYTYNPNSDVFTYPATLISGVNTIVVTATNTSGSGSATTTIVYNQPVEPALPPAITITYPSANPFNTTTPSITVTGTVQMITAKSQMNVMINGMPNNTFTFNASAHTFSINSALIQGANTFVITATNNVGSDSKTQTVIYQQPVVSTTPPPLVTIVNPAANPYNTAVNNVTVNATVMNVTAIGQIGVTLNGGPVPTAALNFNPATHQLTFAVNLIPGANTIVVSATNVAGADSKTETVVYQQPVQTTPPPQITIVNPSSNPYNTSLSTGSINATVMNVTSVGQISVTLNGGPVPTAALNFNPSAHQLMFNVNLIAGANIIVVSATNVGGSDSKTETIIYTAPVIVRPPSITITNPASSPFNTTVNSASIVASVSNINTVSQLTVTLNGSNVPSGTLSFNPTTGQLTFPVNLIVGANVVAITATNTAGTDSKTATLIYSQAPVVQAPSVTITSPATNPYNTTVNSVMVNATVLNVSNASEITLTMNGTATNAFAFNASTHQLTYSANLINGANTVMISATNTAGTDSKTETIIYTIPVVTPAPVVTITNPGASPFNTSSNTATVNATVMNVALASNIAVSVNGTGTTAFNFDPSSHQLMLNLNLIAGSNTISITATNAGGSDSKTTTIIYTAPPVIQPPVVSYTNPTANPFATTSASQAVVAKVLNVTTASQVTVKVNGTVLTTFGFLAVTKKVSFTANLVEGSNTIIVTGTNSAGSDSKTLTINYTKATGPIGTNPLDPAPLDTIITHTPVPTGNATPTGSGAAGTLSGGGSPTILLVSPTSLSTVSNAAVYTVVTKVDNISKVGGLSVKINGAPFGGYTYDKGTKNLVIPVTLAPGENKVLIEATNGTTTKSETITIHKMR